MRRWFVLAGLPLAVVALSVLTVALTIPNEELPRQITLATAIIGAGGFVLTHVRAALKDESDKHRKEAETKERLRVTPFVTFPTLASFRSQVTKANQRHSVIGVLLYNELSAAPLNISEVVLNADGKSVQLVTNVHYRKVSDKTPVRFLECDRECKLEPRDSCKFYTLSDKAEFRAEMLLMLSQDKLSLTVKSFSGESWTLLGKEIQLAIAEVFSTAPEGEKKPTISVG